VLKETFPVITRDRHTGSFHGVLNIIREAGKENGGHSQRRSHCALFKQGNIPNINLRMGTHILLMLSMSMKTEGSQATAFSNNRGTDTLPEMAT
jgi:hypothetical protein